MHQQDWPSDTALGVFRWRGMWPRALFRGQLVVLWSGWPWHVASGDGEPSPYFPVPVRDAVCGELLALSVTASVAVRVPVVVGANFTLTVQCDFAAKLVPQVVDDTR